MRHLSLPPPSHRPPFVVVDFLCCIPSFLITKSWHTNLGFYLSMCCMFWSVLRNCVISNFCGQNLETLIRIPTFAYHKLLVNMNQHLSSLKLLVTKDYKTNLSGWTIFPFLHQTTVPFEMTLSDDRRGDDCDAMNGGSVASEFRAIRSGSSCPFSE